MESPVQAYKNSVGEETRTGEPALSVILPCYNEQEVLEETYRRVSAVCGRLSCSYELVFVNDGSVDGTWEQLVKLGIVNLTPICQTGQHEKGNTQLSTSPFSL